MLLKGNPHSEVLREKEMPLLIYSLHRKEQADSKSHLLRAEHRPTGTPTTQKKMLRKEPLDPSERRLLPDLILLLILRPKHSTSDSDTLEGAEGSGLRDPNNENIIRQLHHYVQIHTSIRNFTTIPAATLNKALRIRFSEQGYFEVC